MNARSLAILVLLVGLARLAGDAGAVSPEEKSMPTTAAGDAYAAGVAAFERGDWQGVLDAMAEVVAARPWDDDAYTRMGYAHRKLGDYDASLAAYDKALRLNPHSRSALEYVGEAYLELGRPDDARAALERLATACRRTAVEADGAGWQADCEEWQELKAAYDAYLDGAGGPEAKAATR